jgi:hypothetical protein
MEFLSYEIGDSLTFIKYDKSTRVKCVFIAVNLNAAKNYAIFCRIIPPEYLAEKSKYYFTKKLLNLILTPVVSFAPSVAQWPLIAI